MRFCAIFVLSCSLTLTGVAETIDRVVATVNGRPILHSDVDETVRYEAFVEGRPLNKISDMDVQASIQRMIDQELLRQQMGQVSPEVGSAEVEKKTAELRAQRAASPEQWRAQLAAYGLDQTAFAAHLVNQLRTLDFLDRRLRPSVLVERAAVESYYRDTLLPNLHNSGVAKDPPLTEVQRDIREILMQQRMDEMLSTWLHNLRQQSRVRILLDAAQVASATGGSARAK
jgi:peptidyl-prolyl cis-trans isomerase SurA